jgi:hypothetical protein
LSARGRQLMEALAAEMKVEVTENKGIFDRIKDKFAG